MLNIILPVTGCKIGEILDNKHQKIKCRFYIVNNILNIVVRITYNRYNNRKYKYYSYDIKNKHDIKTTKFKNWHLSIEYKKAIQQFPEVF